MLLPRGGEVVRLVHNGDQHLTIGRARRKHVFDGIDIGRLAAAHSLGQLHAEPRLAVPALIKNLPGDDNLYRSSILISLANFGTNARTAVPVIVSALTDQDELVRQSAAFALKEIDPEAAAKAGLK